MICRFMNEFKKRYESITSGELAMINPINAYLVVKRLVAESQAAKLIMDKNAQDGTLYF